MGVRVCACVYVCVCGGNLFTSRNLLNYPNVTYIR